MSLRHRGLYLDWVEQGKGHIDLLNCTVHVHMHKTRRADRQRRESPDTGGTCKVLASRGGWFGDRFLHYERGRRVMEIFVHQIVQ